MRQTLCCSFFDEVLLLCFTHNFAEKLIIMPLPQNQCTPPAKQAGVFYTLREKNKFCFVREKLTGKYFRELFPEETLYTSP